MLSSLFYHKDDLFLYYKNDLLPAILKCSVESTLGNNRDADSLLWWAESYVRCP